MRHKRHAAFGQGGGVFFRPDNVFGLLQYGCPILDDELQFGVQPAELDGEASFERKQWPGQLACEKKYIERLAIE